MPDASIARRGALYEIYRTGTFGDVSENPGITIQDRPALSIVQIAAWSDQVDAAVEGIRQASGVTPERQPCRARIEGDTAALWLGPDRWLIVEKETRNLYAAIGAAVSEDIATITDQSHSRCVIRVSGAEVRNLLRKGTTLDLDDVGFGPGEVKTTSLFHMNAVLHCIDANCFDIYVARSFGHSFYEVLTHASAEYGYHVADPL